MRIEERAERAERLNQLKRPRHVRVVANRLPKQEWFAKAVATVAD